MQLGIGLPLIYNMLYVFTVVIKLKSDRKIIHIDCDCFFAAVEMRDNPKLKVLPIGVGGRAENRGVLTTCNYPARKFGLHSAMPTAEALRLCPELILIPPRFAAYKQASQELMVILRQYTDLLEPLSLDEAFLDVTGSHNASLLAEHIRQEIAEKVGVTVSAGVSVNKFLAKIASDWHKPDGLFVLRPQHIEAFIQVLPVKKIPGVGKAAMIKMEQLGIHTCGDLQNLPQHRLLKEFGSFGKRLYDYARGIDNREVKPQRLRKSLSVEQTFAHDLLTAKQAEQAMHELIAKFTPRWQALEREYQIHKLAIKLRYNDFSTVTLEQSSPQLQPQLWFDLLNQAREKKTLPIRLMGIAVGLEPRKVQQLSLFT